MEIGERSRGGCYGEWGGPLSVGWVPGRVVS